MRQTQEERIEDLNDMGRLPTALAESLVGILGALADAAFVEQLESELDRELTDAEFEWIADGWVPASVLVEL